MPADLAPVKHASALDYMYSQRRWVLWQYDTLPNGKKTKVPYSPHDPSQKARSNDPRTWGTWEEATWHWEEFPDRYGYQLDGETNLICLDLDGCRDTLTGEIELWAADLVDECGSYTEITPSGTGLRIIGLAGNWDKSVQQTIRKPAMEGSDKNAALEIYHNTPRYITVSRKLFSKRYTGLRDISTATNRELADWKRQEEARRQLDPARNMTASIEAVRSQLAWIPNDDWSWDDWAKVGAAVHSATGGSEEGLQAWISWSEKCPAKHSEEGCIERWQHWERSPFVKIGYGTLAHLAMEAEQAAMPDDPHAFDDALEQAQAKKAERVSKFRPMSMAELDELPAPNWLIHNLIPENGFVMLAGERGAFKSFVAVDMACALSIGAPWLGSIETKRPIKVAYCAGEGQRGVRQRIKAWEKERGLRSDVGVVPAVPLLNPEGSDLADFIDAMNEYAPEIVIVDTVQRASMGLDINSAKDVGYIVAAADEIRNKVTSKPTVLLVHHVGKDASKGSLGSVALPNAVDTEIYLERGDDMTAALRWSKQKDQDDDIAPIGIRATKISVEDRHTLVLKVEKVTQIVPEDRKSVEEAAELASYAALEGGVTAVLGEASEPMSTDHLVKSVAVYLGRPDTATERGLAETLKAVTKPYPNNPVYKMLHKYYDKVMRTWELTKTDDTG